MHDRIAHTLDELENLYLRPFRAQAQKRARVRRDDPDRRERRAAAAEVDDSRDGEHCARQAGRGRLVFDGYQPTLLQVRPEVVAEEMQRTRKRRRVTALEWASPPPPAPPSMSRRPRRPATQLIRLDSTPEVPIRLGTPLPAAAAQRPLSRTEIDTDPKPLGHDSRNSLACNETVRQPHVYTVPVTKASDASKIKVASRGGGGGAGRGGEIGHALGRTTSESLSPDELDGAKGTPHSSPPSRALSRPRTAAVSPFSSRSTLESAGETLAPASAVNSLQQTSSSETSPRLANARVPPASASTMTAARKLSVSYATLTAAEDLAVLDHVEAFPMTHLHQRPYSSPGRTSMLPATDEPPVPSSGAMPRGDDLPFLGAQPSFSALPPVPPLPFDFAPPFGNSSSGIYAPYSQTRSNHPAEPVSSVRIRQSGGPVERAVAYAHTYDPATSSGHSIGIGGGGGCGGTHGVGNKEVTDTVPPLSSDSGWGASFVLPRGSETTRLPESTSRSSTVGSAGYASGDSARIAGAAAAAAHHLLERDVLRRFSTAAHEDDMSAELLYPPLSQETVIESGQSQDTAEMSDDIDDDEPR